MADKPTNFKRSLLEVSEPSKGEEKKPPQPTTPPVKTASPATPSPPQHPSEKVAKVTAEESPSNWEAAHANRLLALQSVFWPLVIIAVFVLLLLGAWGGQRILAIIIALAIVTVGCFVAWKQVKD